VTRAVDITVVPTANRTRLTGCSGLTGLTGLTGKKLFHEEIVESEGVTVDFTKIFSL